MYTSLRASITRILTGAAMAVAVSATATPAFASGHLYVTNWTGTHVGVYRYPLDANGLPSSQPENFLGGGLKDAFQVAVDRAGYLYVSTDVVQRVNVYAPGASGDVAPVRYVNVRGPDFLTVDDSGYLYVTAGYMNQVDVFKPGAGRNASPANVLTLHADDTFDSIATDRDGALYVGTRGSGLYYYKHPLTEQLPDRIFKTDGITFPVAFDRDDNRIYYRDHPSFRRGWSGSEYGANQAGFGPLPENPWRLYSYDCYSRGGSFEYGLAVNRNYLMFTCGSVTNTLYVLHNHFGRQGRPVEVINLPHQEQAVGLALGP